MAPFRPSAPGREVLDLRMVGDTHRHLVHRGKSFANRMRPRAQGRGPPGPLLRALLEGDVLRRAVAVGGQRLGVVPFDGGVVSLRMPGELEAP